MRKIYLTLTFFLCISLFTPLLAQDNGIKKENNSSPVDTGIGLRPYSFAFGPRISLGAGQLNSVTLNQNFQLVNSKITNYSSKSTYDLCYSLGVFLEKKISSRWAFSAELNYNFFSSRFEPTYTEINPSAGIDKKEIYSEVKNAINVLQIPVSLKYSLSAKGHVYLMAGLNMNLMAGGKITVSDFATEYQGASTSSVSSSATGTLDGLGSPTFSGIVGLGFTTGVSGKPLHLELRALLPLTGAEVNSSTDVIATTYDASAIFSTYGKANLEAITGKSLNDFKMTIIGISASLGLYAH